jgi:hypothetical protein
VRDPHASPLSAVRTLLARAGYAETLLDPVAPGDGREGPRAVPVHQRASFRTRRDELVMLPAELASGLLRQAGARRPHRLFQVGAVARYRPDDPNELAVEQRLGVQIVGAAGPAPLLEVIDLARGLVADAPLVFNAGACAAALFERHQVPPERRRDQFAELARVPEKATDGGGAPTVEKALATLGAPGAEALALLPPEQRRAILLDLLAALDVRFIGRRAPEDVVDNLLRRVDAARQRAHGRDVLAPLGKLVALRAPWTKARAALKRLLGNPLALAPVDALASHLNSLGFSGDRLVFAGGDHVADLRADEVAFTLGPVAGWSWRQPGPDGEEVPVAGFEVPVAALAVEAPPTPIEVLVVPIAEAELGPALALARGLRAAGLSAELEVAGRGLRTAIQNAVARGIPYLALLGETEVAAGRFLLKDLARRSQQAWPLDAPSEAAAAVRGA